MKKRFSEEQIIGILREGEVDGKTAQRSDCLVFKLYLTNLCETQSCPLGNSLS
jgi:hypothetical protein